MTQFAVIEEVDEAELNLQKNFAAGMLSGKYSTHELAKMLFPGDEEKQLEVSMFWPTDPKTMMLRKELIDTFGHEYFLPTVEETAQDLYQLSRVAFDHDVKRKALVDYAKLRGFMDGKGSSKTKIVNNINDNSVTQNNQYVDQSKVLVVQDFGTNDQHAAGLEAQQKRLRNGGL